MSVLHRFTKLEQGEMRWENVRFALQDVALAWRCLESCYCGGMIFFSAHSRTTKVPFSSMDTS